MTLKDNRKFVSVDRYIADLINCICKQIPQHKRVLRTQEPIMYDLSETKRNAFAILAYTSKALKETGLGELVEAYKEKAISSDYDNLLAVSQQHISIANAQSEEG